LKDALSLSDIEIQNQAQVRLFDVAGWGGGHQGPFWMWRKHQGNDQTTAVHVQSEERNAHMT